MKTRTIHLVFSLPFLLWSAQALAQPTGPLGCWQSDDFAGDDLAVAPDGTYWHAEESGQWLVEGSQIWLVNEDFVGTKWVFSVIDDELTLNRPEDFNYLGEGRYMYLQFTPIDTVLTFQRSESEQECGQRYANAIGNAERQDEPNTLELETATLGVEVDTAGNPSLCVNENNLCAAFLTADADFSGDFSPARSWSHLSYFIWIIKPDVPSDLMQLDGSRCERTEDGCDLGVGFLLLFYDDAGHMVSGLVDLTPEQQTDSQRPLEASASMGVIWLTAGEDCIDDSGLCRRELFFGVDATPGDSGDDATVVVGPYQTGVADESTVVADDGSSTTCWESRRADAVIEGERLITITHSFDIESESATSETFVATDDRFELVQSNTVPAPLLVRDCEPSP